MGRAGNNREPPELWENVRDSEGPPGNGPSLCYTGQVPEMSGRDNRMSSVLIFNSYLLGNFRK